MYPKKLYEPFNSVKSVTELYRTIHIYVDSPLIQHRNSTSEIR